MEDQATSAMPLPQWQSHKKVWGDKIVEISKADEQAESAMDDSGFIWKLACGAYVHVSNKLLARVSKDDALGGYYVRYADGFESWSPAKAFEEGYTRI